MHRVYFIALFALFLLNEEVSGQETGLLKDVPGTKEQFVASEKRVLATIEWLENTPFKSKELTRNNQLALLLAWVSNSPTVNVELNQNVLIFTKKHPELLVYFLGGWTRYALQNDYSEDVMQGNLAGIRMVLNVYQLGGMKKDKQILKLMELEKAGQLEQWVADQLEI